MQEKVMDIPYKCMNCRFTVEEFGYPEKKWCAIYDNYLEDKAHQDFCKAKSVKIIVEEGE